MICGSGVVTAFTAMKIYSNEKKKHQIKLNSLEHFLEKQNVTKYLPQQLVQLVKLSPQTKGTEDLSNNSL